MFSRVAIIVLLMPSTVVAQHSRDCRHDRSRNNYCATDAQLRTDRNPIPNYAAQLRAAQAAFESAVQTKRAARLVADGDCTGAEKYALKSDNLGLAQQVREYCHR